MKNAVLLHGTGSNPDNFWFRWLRQELAANGYGKIYAPQLPDTDNPRLDTWPSFVLDNYGFDEDTLLIGHSAGCPTALAILERLQQPIRRTILVAGFVRLAEMEDDHPMLLQSPDWEAMRRNGGEFYFLNSDNDPWGCTHAQGEQLRSYLGGTLVVASGQGHFGSAVFEQPYERFPLLRDLCLLETGAYDQ